MDLTQTQVAINDPWDSAENPQVASPEYWGQCSIDMFYCILEKGIGKVRFDDQVHEVGKRRTAIEIVVTPLPAMGAQNPVSRSLVAESADWAKTTLPSIKALGLSLREMQGKYVHIQFKATGKTYTNKDGEVKNNTALEFVKVFQTEADCTTDYTASKGGSTPAPSNTQYEGGNGNGANKERETALQFLKVIVENAARGQTDLTVIRNTVAANVATMPLVNKFFTVDSPETSGLIMEKMTK